MSAEPPAILAGAGLHAGYGPIPVIRDVDLRVAAGEVVALLGANGAGKTTTILTLAGVLSPSAGEVRWDGQEVRDKLARRARRGLGLVTEERSVFSQLTTAENLRVGRGTAGDCMRMFPELEEHAKRKAGMLSGGQQQMLTLGRALAANPKVLLADELTLGLAPLMAARLLQAVRQAADQGVGVLLVEQHVRQALSIADHAYVLRRGEVVDSGSGAQLRKRVDQIRRHYL